MNKVTAETIIDEVITTYPQAEKVFERHFTGGCYTCPAWEECMRQESIAMGARTHEVDLDTILDELKNLIDREA